jgi:hypothetical protein
MSKHAFRPEGPAPDSYSRVTDAARFQGLHRVALDRIQQLESKFSVRRIEPYDRDADLATAQPARATVQLQPTDSSAAPISVAFTTFPGILVRAGQWTLQAFPACGCDACAETMDGESQRFLELIDDVVAGRFRESITIPWLGTARQEWRLWSPNGSSGGGRSLERRRAKELVKDESRSRDWKPWPPRSDRFAAV